MSAPAAGAIPHPGVNGAGRREVRALTVVETLPYPPQGGVDLRNWGTVNALLALGPVAVFGIRPIDRPPPPRAGIEAWERSHDPGARRLLTRGWTRPAPEWVGDPRGHPLSFPISDTVLTELAMLVERFEPSVVVVEQLWLHGCIDACRRMGLPVVLDAHNVEGELIPAIIARGLNGRDRIDPTQLRTIAERTASIEAAAVRSVDAVWACSHQDAGRLADLYCPKGPVRVVPHALDLDHYPTAAVDRRTGPTIVLPGVFSYPPNAEAAEWLAGDIFPSLRKLVPEARLVLVGPEPTPMMVAAAATGDAGVTVTGAVPDVRPYLADADVMALPLRTGGGARLKVLEAFASGVPVVSTAKGMEGLEVDGGQHYLEAERTEEFCQAIAELASDRRLRQRLAARGRAYVRERHSSVAAGAAARTALPSGMPRPASPNGKPRRPTAPPTGRAGPHGGAPGAPGATALRPGANGGASAPPAAALNGARVRARDVRPLSRPTLSVCMTTRGPAERVHALLRMLRPHTDEIVLAVDRAGDPRTASVCAELADRTLGYELEGASPAKLIGWVMHQCQADWVLRVDDDEAPAAGLLEALPTLLADRRIMQVAFTRRWLFPDRRRYLSTFPWGHDSQTRLVRNLPGLWSFPGWNHEEGHYWGERRWVDLPLYHCDLVVNDLPARRRKSAWYERIEPGQHWDGFPVNQMYAPEDCGAVETEPVPLDDQPLIDVLLAPASVGETPAGPPPPAAPWEEIDRHNLASSDLSAARARINLVRPRNRMPIACERSFQVVVENLGTQPWPGRADSPFRLGYRWINLTTGRPLPDEGFRTSLTETVWPGQSTRLHLHTRTPPVPGEFLLTVQLVHEGVAWIEESGRTRVVIEDERPGEAPPFAPQELRVMSAQLWHRLEEADRSQRDLARELALAQRRAAALAHLRDTRRYRFGAAVARPLDLIRTRLRARS